MPDEELVESTAPATIPAETPAPATQPDAAKEEPAAEKRSFTQEELNEIVQKEKAKAEAKAERRFIRSLEKFQPQVQRETQPDVRPTRSMYANDESYIEGLTDWKLDQRQARDQYQGLTDKTERLYAQAEKLSGFNRAEFDALPLTGPIAQTITDSDVAPRLMAFMSANPDEVARIANLSPARQAAEIGKLEVKLSTAVKTSKTPDPINPIGGGQTTMKSLENANFADYKKQREAQNPRWRR